jgi:hypothetical protein
MSTPYYFAPVVAESGEAVKLAMQRLWIAGKILPAGARLTVQHIFRSEQEKPSRPFTLFLCLATLLCEHFAS